MPIRPERRHLYGPEWPAISDRIRFSRARGRCECEGECGKRHNGRCVNQHGTVMESGALCVLTVAHLDHDETNHDWSNLRAMCQGCHNRYDSEHRRAGIRQRTREKLEALGQLTLGLGSVAPPDREGDEVAAHEAVGRMEASAASVACDGGWSRTHPNLRCSTPEVYPGRLSDEDAAAIEVEACASWSAWTLGIHVRTGVYGLPPLHGL